MKILIQFFSNIIKDCSVTSRIATSPTNSISIHYAEPLRHLAGFNSVTMPASLLRLNQVSDIKYSASALFG